MSPPLGFIEPALRTKQQQDAHAAAVARHVQFALRPAPMVTGQKIALYDFWKHPDVVADVGFVFDRIHQITGSCVWAGGTNAVFTTIAAQRVAADNPTKAFLPFTLHNYALSRHYMGDDGKGEGSMGSTFGKSLGQDGIRDWTPGQNDLPQFTHTDGISVSKSEELNWSTYRNPEIKDVLEVSKAHLFGSVAECHTTDDIRAMIQNGYGVTFACNNYIGDASIEGSGDDACVVGFWNGRGGHQQSIHAVWEHPTLGPLFWAQNNWPGSTYPKDPAGGPICGCWVKEAKVEAAMRLDSEVYGLSSLDWFPAQPNVIQWSKM